MQTDYNCENFDGQESDLHKFPINRALQKINIKIFNVACSHRKLKKKQLPSEHEHAIIATQCLCINN